MKHSYLSTFASGFQEFIEKELRRHVSDIDILKVLDGAIFYRTKSDWNRMRQMSMFNNSFEVLMDFKDKGIDGMLRESMDFDFSKLRSMKIEKGTFRIITSKENQLISADKDKIRELEGKIMHTGLKLNRSKPGTEIWILQRSEGIGFFMIRITKHKDYGKILQKGELRPDLSAILCLMSRPSIEDVFLDPFCGYGAIAIARSMMPYRKIIAIDNDSGKIDFVKQKIASKKNFQIFSSDSMQLEKIRDASVDKIVTDPPWGIFDNSPVDKLYENMVQEFYRIVRPNGVIVILTAQKELMDSLLSRMKGKLLLEKRYDVLVSGKKAAAYSVKRI